MKLNGNTSKRSCKARGGGLRRAGALGTPQRLQPLGTE